MERSIQNKGFDRDDLIVVRQNSHEYLLRSIKIDGSFFYSRSVKTGLVVSSKYNLLRHSGAVLSLLEGMKFGNHFLRTPHVLQALRFQTLFLHDVVVSERRYSTMIDGGAAKLGGAALCLLGLVEIVRPYPDSKFSSVAEELADYILSQQAESGKFQSIRYLDRPPKKFESLYYPGEAILALLKAFRTFGSDKYLVGAISGIRYLVNRYALLTDEELPHDHWFMLAARELDDIEIDPEIRSAVLRMGLAICDSALVDNVSGTAQWGIDGRVCPAATRGEGLGAAIQIALRSGHFDKAFLFVKRLEQAVAFCLAHQVVRPWVEEGWANASTIGGFMHSADKHVIRIDYVQHAIGMLNALLNARSLMSV